MKAGSRGVAGIILAGGASKRMRDVKALLPAPRLSALETITRRMRGADVSEIIVVTGGHMRKVAREAKRLNCRTVHNDEYISGMFSGVVTGIRALPDCTEAFFLITVTVPLVKISTYRELTDAFFESYGNPDVVYPTFQGLRGHPPLIGRTMIRKLLSWSGERGLHGFLAERVPRSMDMPTGDRATTLDMDTQDGYGKLLAYARTETCPDEAECAELLHIAGTPEGAVRHSRVVASAAARIAESLSRCGAAIDMRLLAASCLLHDIAKGEKDHESRGARWLRKRGYAKVAEVVASHKDLTPSKNIGEAEILYLSDKITDGDAVSTLAHRMARMEDRFQRGSEALRNARRRIETAMDIERKIESITGLSLSEILGSDRDI
jgi:CTP:molybdopterin cytidylyltransferase MocA